MRKEDVNSQSERKDTDRVSDRFYEPPLVVEVGKAAALTLGTSGHSSDNCGCSLPNQIARLF
jgi:hypothetical protein